MLKRALQSWLFGSVQTTVFRGTVNGVPYVSASNALQFTPVYRATTLIATDVARIPLELSDAGAASLMANPSPYMSAFDFRRAMSMCVLLWGNAFALVNRTRGGELLSLTILDPASVALDMSGDAPRYRAAGVGLLPMEDVLHLRAPGTTGLWGESPIELCRTSVQLLGAQEKMALTAYQNGANPKIAILHPGKLSPELMQAMEADYMRRHAGAENTGRPFIGMEGVKLERISSTVDDTGIAQARAYSVGDVSRIYGVPASYLSENVGSSYGSMEWLSRMYVDSCLSGWLRCWSSEIESKLLAPGGTARFDTDELIRPGIAEQMAALRTAVESGIITRNEARDWLGYEAIAGGDSPVMAMNIGAGGGSTNIGTDTSAQAGTANDH